MCFIEFAKKIQGKERTKMKVTDFKSAKEKKDKIVMCTAYDYSTAVIESTSGIESILVGDSLGMTMLGYNTTLQVTMEDMISHTAAVKCGAGNITVVADMPFMSYQASVYDAVTNAGRLVKEGMADAVKLEGGISVREQIKAIVGASIPVMAHIGMTPQSVNIFGGFKVQGKSLEAAKQLAEDAKAVEEAGAFAVVLECVPAAIAEYISEILTIPTIGIGAGAGCDGQILVYQDMLGMNSDFVPKFVKKFAEVGAMMREGFSAYAKEVKDGAFPTEKHSFKADKEITDKLRGLIK